MLLIRIQHLDSVMRGKTRLDKKAKLCKFDIKLKDEKHVR